MSAEIQQQVSYRPTRKVNAGGAAGGLVAFAAAVCEAKGWLHLDPYAWVGLGVAITYVVQYATADRDPRQTA